MSIVEQISEYIIENTKFQGGIDLFLNFLPEGIKKGIVVRFINSSGAGELKTAYIVIYFISREWSLGDREIREMRELLVKYRGICGKGWSVLGDIEVGNEGLDDMRRQVTSLNFRVSYVED